MKINFRYSMPYDEMLSIMQDNDFSHSQSLVAKEYIGKVEAFWEKEGKKIIREIDDGLQVGEWNAPPLLDNILNLFDGYG